MVLTMDIPSDLIALHEAAKEYGEEKLGALGVKYATIRQWTIRGELRSWRRGERIFVSRAELEEMIRPKPAQG